MRRPCTKPGPDHTPPARGRAQARSRGAHLGLEQHARLLQPRRAGRAGGGGRRERRRRGRGRAGAAREGGQRGGQRRGEQQRAEHALCIMTRARGMCQVAKRRAQRAPTPRHATGGRHATREPPCGARPPLESLCERKRGACCALLRGCAGRQAGRQAGSAPAAAGDNADSEGLGCGRCFGPTPTSIGHGANWPAQPQP